MAWAGGAAAPSADLAKVCKETPCRDAVPLNVKVTPQTYYKGSWPRSPYFYRGWGGIAAGETLSFEASAGDQGEITLRYVPQATAASIDVSLAQPTDGVMSMVAIHNKSRYHIVYEAAIYYPRDGSVQDNSTSVCALRAGLTGYESWPYGVLFFAFGNLRSVSESEVNSHGCQ